MRDKPFEKILEFLKNQYKVKNNVKFWIKSHEKFQTIT